jgi:hypothetical protein
MNELDEKKFRNITRPEHRCSYSASCPSVGISKDGKTLRINGAFVKINPEWTEVTIDISTEMVVKALQSQQWWKWMDRPEQVDGDCQFCRGSRVEEVYGGHGAALELPCSHCQPVGRAPDAADRDRGE